MRRAAPGPPPGPARPGAEGQGSGPGLAPATARRRPTHLLIAAVVTTAILVAVLAVGYLVIRHRQQDSLAQLRPSGIPASVPTSLASLMQLSPLPARPAPGFSLTDQHGRTVSLASFKGHAVVLEFMDPHCVDICPIVSREFIDAYHDLGIAARRAVFIAVNVNPYYRTTGDMAAYSAEHQLTTIPSWHFLTGPLASLRAVWSAYQIQVQAPSRNADVIHTSAVYFIAPSGDERFVATPMADHTAQGKAYLPLGQLTAWGRGIALVTRHLTG